MRKLLTGGIAITAMLLATIAGYRLGAGTWPDPRHSSMPASATSAATSPTPRQL